MRLVICGISLVATSLVMVGCGQSGALQLPSQVNHDKRAKYLLYSDAKHQAQQTQNESEPLKNAQDADQVTSEVKSN